MYVSNKFHMGTEFLGSEGRVFVDRGNTIEADPAALLDKKLGPNDTPLYKSTNHAQNFIDGVRNHEQCVAPIQAAHRAIAVAHLGNISMQLGREVNWDPAAETFVNDPQADRLRERAMRGNWHI